MQPGTVLIECTGVAALRNLLDQDAGATAYAIDSGVVFHQGLHLEKRAELLPERQALGGVVNRELNVGNAVHFDGHMLFQVRNFGVGGYINAWAIILFFGGITT